MRVVDLSAGVALLVLGGCSSHAETPASATPYVRTASVEDAGRYLFLIGGCNDCHTPGWAESDGHLPTSAWAVGNPVGFRGPWGTSYAANLRRVAIENTERQWVLLFRKSAGLPPMPWQNYREASETDLLAIRQFLRSLGPAGGRVPDPLPPGKEPRGVYVDLRPRNPSGAGP
jgi:hypothetical protein